MTRLSLGEWIILSTARVIAGHERRAWLDAMEAELDTLKTGRLDWALGSLVASAKDRLWRDWQLGVALVALPTVALATIPFLTLLSAAIARGTGMSMLQLMPVLAAAPAPFAFLLGALRPRGSAWLRGLAAFALYQAIPAVGFSILFGTYIYVRWEANLSAWGLYPSLGFVTSGALWCAGAWLDSRWTRARMKDA